MLLSIAVHVKEIRALAKEGLSAHNFGLGKTYSFEKTRLARVMKIRALELRDIRYSKLGKVVLVYLPA